MSMQLKEFLAKASVSTEEIEVVDETVEVVAELPDETVVDEVEAPAVVEEAPAEGEAVPVEGEPAPALEEGDDLPKLTDGETELEVIECTEGEVSEAVAEMEKSHIEAEEIHRDVEVLVEATESLEAYRQLLEGAMDDGGVNAQAAAFLRVGIERFERLIGAEEQLTPSVEAFGGSMSQQRATVVSLESIGETLKRVWEAIKRGLKALWEAHVETYTKVRSGVIMVNSKANKLAERAKKLKRGSSGPALQITLRNPGKLMANGEWLGDDTTTIAKAVEFIARDFPSAMAAMARDGASAFRGKKYEDLTALDVNSVREALFAPTQKAFMTVGNRVWWDNKVMEFVDNKDRVSFRIELATSATAAPAPESITRDVGSVSDILGKIGALQVQLRHLGDAAALKHRAKDEIDAFTKVVDQFVAEMDKADLTEAERDKVNTVMRLPQQMKQRLGHFQTAILSYLVSVINSQLNYLELQIRAREQADREAEKK